MKQARLGFGDWLRMEWVMLRIDWTLEARVPWRVRRQLKSELRSNLRAASDSVGMKIAIQRLGNLEELGGSYLEVHRGRVNVRAGVWAAVLTYAAIQVVSIAVFRAFSAGIFEGGGRGGGGYEVLPGFGPFAGTVNQGHMVFTWLFLSPAHLLLMLAAFLIGSRAWRLVRR